MLQKPHHKDRAAGDGLPPDTLLPAAVAEALVMASATDVSVVLYGEPGTGRTQAARLLHDRSPRNGRALSFLSGAGGHLGARLAEDTLRRRLEGGTLVLEGIDESSLEDQATLVGAIEEWSSGDERDEAPVRLIATSSRDLSGLMARGGFRKDLFFQLEVFPLHLPPLRERLHELPELVAAMALRHAPEAPSPVLPEWFVAEALAYRWPGNLRELERVVLRACPAGSRGDRCFPRLLSPGAEVSAFPSFHEAKREFERSYVQRLLLLTAGNVTRAADVAGKARKDFYALMSRNNVDPAGYRSGSSD